MRKSIPSQSFDHLSQVERRVVGAPEDWGWDDAEVVAPPRRSGRTQFSLRVEPEIADALAELARVRSLTFSEVVRDALRQYIGAGGQPDIGTAIISMPRRLQVVFQTSRSVITHLPGTTAERDLEGQEAGTTLATVG